MKKRYFNTILPEINSNEEYDNLDRKSQLFESTIQEIITFHHLPNESLTYFEGTNVVFSMGNTRIIKIFPPIHQSHFQNEVLLMKKLYNKISISTPAIEFVGEISGWPYIVMSQLDGILLENLWEKLDFTSKAIIIRELGSLIHEVHRFPTDGLESLDCHWPQFIKSQIKQCIARQQATNFPEKLLMQIPEYLESAEELLPKLKNQVILTGEYTPMNLLVKQIAGTWHITGLIDFGDSMLGLPEYDLLGPGLFLIQGDKKLLREFLTAYGYSPEDMTEKLSYQLTVLMLLHRYSNLNVQIRIKDWNSKINKISELESLVWGF